MKPDVIDEYTGMTESEREIDNCLTKALRFYRDLPQQHIPTPINESADFIRGIYELKRILKSRIVDRQYPEYWRD